MWMCNILLNFDDIYMQKMYQSDTASPLWHLYMIPLNDRYERFCHVIVYSTSNWIRATCNVIYNWGYWTTMLFHTLSLPLSIHCKKNYMLRTICWWSNPYIATCVYAASQEIAPLSQKIYTWWNYICQQELLYLVVNLIVWTRRVHWQKKFLK
jgi:hypothetical protein